MLDKSTPGGFNDLFIHVKEVTLEEGLSGFMDGFRKDVDPELDPDARDSGETRGVQCAWCKHAGLHMLEHSHASRAGRRTSLLEDRPPFLCIS